MEENRKEMTNEEFIEKYYNKNSDQKRKSEEELDKMLEDFKNELKEKENNIQK